MLTRWLRRIGTTRASSSTGGQKNHQKVTFEIVRSTVRGRSGRKEYECCVSIAGKPQQSAVEYTVKAAEQLAAEKTYKAMEAAGKTKPACDTK